jgi:hypothetical protein
MKRVISILLASMAITSATGWAQTASVNASPESGDPIVRMHQQIAAANRIYDAKVNAAKKVYAQKKASATKERDAAIAAARNGVPSDAAH